MISRELVWRGTGLTIFTAACAIGLASRSAGGGAAGLVEFALALIGIVLIVQGKRVPLVWRIECSSHRNLALAVRAARQRRSTTEYGQL